MSLAAGQGSRLGVDDLGCGEPALLLLTGWCSSRARWTRVAPLLAKHWRVINFEWRGHGESAPAEGDFGTPEMVQDALEVVDAAGVHRFIPCSASHSGWVAIELRRRLGERVPGIVHLDWMVTEPSDAYMGLIRELQSEQRWPVARDKLFEIWRGGERRPEVEEALSVMRRHDAEMWMRSGRVIEASYRTHGSPLKALSELEPPPVLHVYGQPADPDYLEVQREFAREQSWFDVCRLDSVRTHFSMLEAPEEVASLIERHATAVRA